MIDGDAHILPEYMFGYTYRKPGREYNSAEDQMYERKLVKSNVTNHKKYNYYFFEKSINSDGQGIRQSKNEDDYLTDLS